MTTIDRLDELLSGFIQLEEEQGLWQREVAGCRYWHYIRQRVFHVGTSRAGVLDALAPIGRRQYVRHAWGDWRGMPEALRRYDYSRLSPADVLFLDHTRHAGWGGVQVSPYTHFLLQGLPATYHNLKFSHLGRHHVSDGLDRVIYLDAAFAASEKAFAALHRWGAVRRQTRLEAQALAKVLAARLEGAPGAAELDTMLWNAVRVDRGFGQICDWILDRVRPKLVVNVVHYNRACMALTVRAKQRGIPVAELQHGTVTPAHIPYRFAQGAQPPGRPDYFLSFGEYWSDMLDGMGLPRERCVPVGFAWLDRHVTEKPPRPEGRRRLLVISQGSVATELSRWTAEAAPALHARGWSITYRLHPAEVAGWEARMPWLTAAPGTTVSTGANEPLYEAFAGASVQLGVYSTALFEGLAFGLTTLVARVPGSQALSPLVERGSAHFVASPGDLVEALRGWSPTPVPQRLVEQVWARSPTLNFHRFVASML